MFTVSLSVIDISSMPDSVSVEYLDSLYLGTLGVGRAVFIHGSGCQVIVALLALISSLTVAAICRLERCRRVLLSIGSCHCRE